MRGEGDTATLWRSRHAWLIGAVATALAAAVPCAILACGETPAETTSPPMPDAGDAGSSDGCSPGFTPLDAGGCAPPGVPPGSCGDGFKSEDAGCVAILPAEACAKGTYAVPGDTACHDVMDCGDAPWGTIPLFGASVQYVNGSFTGTSIGTGTAPWKTIQQAIEASASGGLVAITDGTYVENVVVVGRTVKIWGRCPSKVTIVASAPSDGSTGFALGFGDADGSEVHGVALTGNGAGLVLQQTTEAVADHLWIHDTTFHGIEMDFVPGSPIPSLALSNSLIEFIHGGSGLALFTASMTVDGVAIRDTIPSATDPLSARGIDAEQLDDGDGPSTLTVTRSIVERASSDGAFIEASSATFDGIVVQETVPEGDAGMSPGRAFGVFAQIDVNAHPATVVVQHGVFEGNAVVASGSNLTVENTTIRHTRGDINTGGVGIELVNELWTHHRSTGIVTSCLVEDGQEAGIFVGGADVTVTGALVRNTVGSPTSLYTGGGIMAFHDPEWGSPLPSNELERANLTVITSLMENNYGFGVFGIGADVTIQHSESSHNLPREPDGFFGRGVQIQGDYDAEPPIPASANVSDSLFVDNFEEGVCIAGAPGTVERIVVQGTKKGSKDMQLGDGMAAFGVSGYDSKVDVQSAEFTHNARAGVATFGASVTLADSTLECNAFDLSDDPVEGSPASFHDEGGNTCGCQGKTSACVARSANLSVPNLGKPPKE